MVSVVEVSPKDPMKHSEVFAEKVHTARVMRCFINENTGEIYSIGEDKMFRVYDIKNRCIT